MCSRSGAGPTVRELPASPEPILGVPPKQTELLDLTVVGFQQTDGSAICSSCGVFACRLPRRWLR